MLQWRSAVSFEEIYDNSSRGWMEGLGFKIKTLPREVVTYHAPCDLWRKIGVYDTPSSLLNDLIGIELREIEGMKDQT